MPGKKYKVYDPDWLGGLFQIEILKPENSNQSEGAEADVEVVSWRGESIDGRRIKVAGKFEYTHGQSVSEKLKYSVFGGEEILLIKESEQAPEGLHNISPIPSLGCCGFFFPAISSR